MSSSSSRAPVAARPTVDRFAWPVVLVLLLTAVVTIVGAAWQADAVNDHYDLQDRLAAEAASKYTANFLGRRLAEQADVITANADVFGGNSIEPLRTRLVEQVLPFSPEYVLGVAVTYADGRLALVTLRNGMTFDEPALGPDLVSTAQSAAGTGGPAVSGRLELEGKRLAYAQATPLSGVSSRYAAWLVLYAVDDGPLGSYFEDAVSSEQRSVALVDDRGRVLSGSRDTVKHGSDAIRRSVKGSGWDVVGAPADRPQAIPGWAYPLLLVGFLLLTAFSWMQEATRRALRKEADARALQLRRLFELASELVHARGPRDQAERLARAAVELTGADGARVRIARERDRHGIVAGRAQAGAWQYRLAIIGPHEPLGEIICYREDGPVTATERAALQTMSTLAGAAMHNQVVLERERATAIELQRIDELRTNLLSTVAHELRSPLTAVKGVLALLGMQGDLSDKQREYVDVAAERTDALVSLIQDLFDCSLLESGQLDIKPQRVLATEVLERALGALAASRPDDIWLNATPNLRMTVDPLRFDQIVNNLVTNAFRHGAAPVEVQVRPYAEGACVEVTDNGPGIPQEERDRIFSKFYQADSGHARLVEGAGLGLALVHGLVTLHGGRIEVDSASLDGRGARFRVYLPDVGDQATDDGGLGLPPDDDIAPLRDIV